MSSQDMFALFCSNTNRDEDALRCALGPLSREAKEDIWSMIRRWNNVSNKFGLASKRTLTLQSRTMQRISRSLVKHYSPELCPERHTKETWGAFLDMSLALWSRCQATTISASFDPEDEGERLLERACRC